MNPQTSAAYFDREEGCLRLEYVHAGRFLDWAYNSPRGRLTTGILANHRWFSSFYGWLHKQRWSRRKIVPFAQKAGVRPDEFTRPLGEFKNFSEFFTREIDLSRRPIRQDPDICLAPCDGKVLAYPVVAPDMSFLIKRNVFNLRSFLGDDMLAHRFAYGAMVVSRLSLADYHHFHFPDSGIPLRPLSIPGKYHAGGSYSRRAPVPYYTENHRMTTLFESDHFGPMVIAEVGAMTVGSIRQVFRPRKPVPRGVRKGYFELGGSTVVLIFQKGKIVLDEDLRLNSKQGIETYVRFGDSIGRRP